MMLGLSTMIPPARTSPPHASRLTGLIGSSLLPTIDGVRLRMIHVVHVIHFASLVHTRDAFIATCLA